MLDQGGKITPAPVPSSPTPFDVDLGTNRADHVVAVYSHDGALHELDIAAGTTKQLHPGVSGRLSEPTMSAGRYAFVARRRGRDVLYLRAVEHGTRAVSTAGTNPQSSITNPRLSDMRLAFVTSGPTRHGLLENLRVQMLWARRSRVVYSARSGGLNFASIVGPGFDTSGTHLYWARRNLGSGTGNRYIRLTLSSGRLAYAQGTNGKTEGGPPHGAAGRRPAEHHAASGRSAVRRNGCATRRLGGGRRTAAGAGGSDHRGPGRTRPAS
jgi:hypothetical protein